jgi:hypothetical protein
MSVTLVNYLKALKKLYLVRKTKQGAESNEEDKLLEKMDVLWLKLTDKERISIQNIPVKSVLNTKM